MAITRGATQSAESAAGTSVTVTTPAHAIGDLLIASSTAGGSIQSLSSDFWPIGYVNATGQWLRIWYLLADGTEQASYVVSQDTSGRLSAQITTYSAINPAAVLDVAAVNATASLSTTAVVHPGLTTVTNGAMMLGVFSVDTSTSASTNKPTQMTQVWKSTSGTGKTHIFAEELVPTAGATGTRAWSQTTGSALDSCAIHAAITASIPASALSYDPAAFDTAAFDATAGVVTVPDGFTGWGISR